MQVDDRAARAAVVPPAVAWGAAASLAAVLIIDFWVAIVHPLVHGDSAGLVDGTGSVLACLRHHRFTHCDAAPYLPRWEGNKPGLVGPWPLLQYLPAVAFRELGLSRDNTIRALIAINATALTAMVAFIGVTLRRVVDDVWRPVLVMALIASPLLWFGTVAFGEALAAAAVLAAVTAALCRARPASIGVLTVFAAVTKETNPAFVFVLVGICILFATRTREERRPRLVALVIGTVVGVVANAGFNIFRFGTVRNSIYLHAYERVPNKATAARAFAALWVSPSGGVIWFWPVAVAILALITTVSLRRLRREPNWRSFGAACIAGLFVVQVAGLSTWYSPFGWITWGPRLLLPLLPAMLVCAVAVGAADATGALDRFLTSRWFAPVTLVAVLAAMPQAAVVYRPLALNEFFIDPLCTNAHVTTPARYYRCFNHLAWAKHPTLLQRGLEGFNTTGGKLLGFVVAVAVASLLLVARAGARARQPTAP